MKRTILFTVVVMMTVFSSLHAQTTNYWTTTGNSFPSLSAQIYFLGTTNSYPLRFRTNNNDRMYISTSGNVGIGTNNPQAKLAVNGEILAKSVRVNTGSTYWPDYVFGKEYKLMSLRELEQYVSIHKHLPGIPSAQEIEKQGDVDLGVMNTLLLEKVEELTRYVIDLQNQIDELKNGKE